MESVVRSDQTTRNLSSETRIGLFVAALAVAAMVVDHLIPGDPIAFLVTSTLALALAAAIFGHIIPRTKANPAASTLAAKRGMVCSLLAVLSIPALFVGLPFVLGGAGIALGLIGRDGDRKRLAITAVVVGALVVLFSAGVYAFLGDSDG
jgi:hypothetical protein